MTFHQRALLPLAGLCSGDTALAITSTNTLDDRQQGRQKPEFESSNVYSSHWDFDLMDLSHLNKLPKLLFPLNFSLCLCSKKVQRVCPKSWPSPCLAGKRLQGVTVKGDLSIRCSCGSKPTQGCASALAKALTV